MMRSLSILLFLLETKVSMFINYMRSKLFFLINLLDKRVYPTVACRSFDLGTLMG